MSSTISKPIFFVVTLSLLLGAFAAGPRPTATGSPYEDTRMETITLTDLNLAESAEAQATGVYESAVTTAPFPFNALVPAWTADPTLRFQLRTRQAGGAWSDWLDLHVNHDLTEEGSAVETAEMWFASAEDVTHDEYQFRLSTALFRVPELRLTFINSTGGPTTDQLIARQLELDAQNPPIAADPNAYPKPFVISRAAWCTDSLCQSGQHTCTLNDPLDYKPVRHLALHHTVSNNDSADWAAVTRAIWNYHATGQCWGDIGYNYLVDMNGIIYEGHRGGDDVVGTHASAANEYSMAISLLGTFTSFTPPNAMQNSVVELLAWKADQKGIDLYSSTYHPILGRGLPNFFGHRDVYGTTACPGDLAHLLMPSLRDRAAQKIGFVSPYIYIDELSGNFTRSGGNWQTGPHQCGINSHSWFTWSTTNPGAATYWGEWRLNVPAEGSYEVMVYAPYCNTGAGETHSANYTIYHKNGTSNATADHEGRIGQWTSIGTYEFSPNSTHRLRLTDLAGDDGRAVWFDAVRIRYLGPQAANQQPTENSWLNNRTVNFNWNVVNGGSVTASRLRVATDEGFGNIVHQVDLPATAASHQHTFGQDYGRLYWQVILFDGAGQPIYSPATSFRMDTQPPTSSIYDITWTGDGTGYVLKWNGTDNASGVAAYRLEYRILGTVNWYTLLDGVTETTTAVVPTDITIAYEFRSQARDRAGNWEAAHDTADISTNDAPSSLALLSPTGNVWVNTVSVPFQWQWLAGSNPAQVRLQVATNTSFTAPIVDVTLLGGTTSYNALIAPDYAQLYWRVLPINGGGGPALVGQFKRDATAPSAAVHKILRLANGRYAVLWQGTDNLAGIASYRVYYRAAGQPNWVLWHNNTTLTQASFAPPDGQVYEFRAEATDAAGNTQSAKTTADLTTASAIQLFVRGHLPVVFRP